MEEEEEKRRREEEGVGVKRGRVQYLRVSRDHERKDCRSSFRKLGLDWYVWRRAWMERLD